MNFMRAINELREMNEYSYQRKLEAAGYADELPELCQDVPFDIDVSYCGPASCYPICPTELWTWLAGSHSSKSL